MVVLAFLWFLHCVGMGDVEKFSGKYRISSARYKGWDYGQQAAYFITICTKDKAHFFGEVISSAKGLFVPHMELSEIGQIVAEEWVKTIELRPDMHLELGEFVVMPNHFHAILIIGKSVHNKAWKVAKFEAQSKNLAAIVRGLKGAVTSRARMLGYVGFEWHPRYHDHIIRDAKAFERIQRYIFNNPLDWGKDVFL